MIKAAPMTITNVRDKMPFELTPFFPRLTRLNSAAENGSANEDMAQNATPK
jgi:hypothetical protein